MATYKRPGTYVEEVLLPQQITALGTATAVGAFLGTSPKGPTAATLVSSWTEFVRLFGSFDAVNNLHLGVYQFFANGGRAAYVARIVGASSASAAQTLVDRAAVTPQNTLTITAVNPGSWANSSNTTTGLSVETVDNGTDRFDFLIYQGGTAAVNVVERFNDLSMSAADARYVVRQINATSQYITVADANSATAPGSTGANRPATGVKTLSSGADGSAPVQAEWVAALTYGGASSKFDAITNSLILNVPDVARLTDALGQEITKAAGIYADNRKDVFVVADVSAATTTVSAAQTWSATLLTAQSNLSATATGAYMALYYPYITIPDPLGVSGTTRSVAPGASIVGLMLANDALQGVQKSPAGIKNPIDNAIAAASSLTATELDSLNTSAPPINAIRSIPGAGIVPFGARTLSSSYPNRYINIRRSLIYLEKALVDATRFAVFENNDERLWSLLRTACSSLLVDFYNQGGLRGNTTDDAFYVKCDETINTSYVIQNGEVRVEVGVALQTPAEFVVLRVGQFQGGSSVVTL
jgi:hypothetical protein